MSVGLRILSHGEEEGLEPFIETLAEGQKAHISKQVENHHKAGGLKGSSAKAARVRFAGSNGGSESSEGEEDDSPPSHSDGTLVHIPQWHYTPIFSHGHCGSGHQKQHQKVPPPPLDID